MNLYTQRKLYGMYREIAYMYDYQQFYTATFDERVNFTMKMLGCQLTPASYILHAHLLMNETVEKATKEEQRTAASRLFTATPEEFGAAAVAAVKSKRSDEVDEYQEEFDARIKQEMKYDYAGVDDRDVWEYKHPNNDD